MNILKQLRGNLGSSLWILRLLVQRATRRHLRVLRAATSGFLCWSVLATPVMGQEDAPGPQLPPAPQEEELSPGPAKVAVQPPALDEEIRERLQSVMEATGWFNAPEVEVVDGVVFPRGIPVTMLDGKQEVTQEAGSLKSSGESPLLEELDAVSTKAEAGLSNDAGILEEQARQAKPVDEEENLLGAATSARPTKAVLTAENKN